MWSVKCKGKLQLILWKRRKNIAPATQNDFRRVLKQVGMSQSVTPATENDMTTCLDTFEKERFCSFPHRHGDSRRNTWEHQNEHFVEDVLQFSHFVSSKSIFSYEFSLIGNIKIDVSCEASVNFHHISQNATPATEFAPCRHLTQPCHCDSPKSRNTTRLKCCACHAKWLWTRPKCCACHEICNSSCENVAKVLPLPHKTTFNTLQNTSDTKCHACHAKWTTPHAKPPKVTPFAELTMGTAIGCERLRTVADGCGQLRTVADGCGRLRTVANTPPSNPRPPEWNGNPCYAFGKKPGIQRYMCLGLLAASSPFGVTLKFPCKWVCGATPINLQGRRGRACGPSGAATV